MLYEFLDNNTARVRIENLDDLWHLEKIIRKGDIIESITTRLFKAESGSERKKVYIKLKVEKTNFHKYNESLRVLGVILEGKPEEYIKKGKHHSFDLREGDEIKLTKEKWLKTDIDRLEESSKENPLIDVLFIDDERAGLYTITNYSVDERGEVHNPIKGKRYDIKDIKRLKNKYLDEIKNLIDKSKSDALIVCGPGIIKNEVMKDIKTNKKIYFCDTHNPGKGSVYEIIKKGELDHILSDFRISQETKHMEEILKRLSKGEKISYGNDLLEDIKNGLVDVLFVSKDKFLEMDKKIIEDLENFGGKLFVFEENTEFIDKFGGMIGFLRW